MAFIVTATPANPNTVAKTPLLKPGTAERSWLLIDAEGQNLGRLASRIAVLLMGKHKRTYTPHVPGGDFIVVVNCEKVAVTGEKLTQKRYWRHSGYWGGIKSRTLSEQLARQPHKVIEAAVWGMLKGWNRKNKQVMNCLKAYKGPDHPHKAQNPKPVKLG